MDAQRSTPAHAMQQHALHRAIQHRQIANGRIENLVLDDDAVGLAIRRSLSSRRDAVGRPPLAHVEVQLFVGHGRRPRRSNDRGSRMQPGAIEANMPGATQSLTTSRSVSRHVRYAPLSQECTLLSPERGFAVHGRAQRSGRSMTHFVAAIDASRERRARLAEDAKRELASDPEARSIVYERDDVASFLSSQALGALPTRRIRSSNLVHLGPSAESAHPRAAARHPILLALWSYPAGPRAVGARGNPCCAAH